VGTPSRTIGVAKIVDADNLQKRGHDFQATDKIQGRSGT